MREPARTQRLGAYAVLFRDAHILLTRISAVGYPAGTWTLPGGGVEHGESPHHTVRRELYEETGLQVITAELIDVHDVHVVEKGRDDQYEDYHGVHLLYAVTADTSIEPRVVERGGTTDLVRWVPMTDVVAGSGPVLPMVGHAIERADHFSPGGLGV